MSVRYDRSIHEGVFLPRVIECPVCGKRAHSFRIRRVMNLRTVVGEFYHGTASCAGSMTPDMPAMDLLRAALEGARALAAAGHSVYASMCEAKGRSAPQVSEVRKDAADHPVDQSRAETLRMDAVWSIGRVDRPTL